MLVGTTLMAAAPAALHAAPVAATAVTHSRFLVSFSVGDAPHAPLPIRSDTAKGERARPDRHPADGRRPLRSRNTAAPRGTTGSGGGTMDPRLLPDQPWETEFYVENDLPQPSRSFARLAWRAGGHH